MERRLIKNLLQLAVVAEKYSLAQERFSGLGWDPRKMEVRTS